MTSFYTSPAYLALVRDVYFAGHETQVKDVRVQGKVFRLLVVDGDALATEIPFLDYHEPLLPEEAVEPETRRGFLRWVSSGVVSKKGWKATEHPGAEPAPYVDFTGFPTFAGYLEHVKSREGGSVIKEQERRRRRLAEDVGPLEFQVDDRGDDVFPLAQKWKSQQLRDTGATDWFSVPKNVEFLRLARERGVMKSSTLRAGGRLLSVWMGFQHDGLWSGWVFAFDHDPALKKYSVGQQLLRSMLEESHGLGHRQFDFSIGDEDYKWMYATHARILGPVGVAPLRERTVKLAKQQAKRVLGRNPALLETVVRLRKRRAMTESTPEPATPMTADTSPPEELKDSPFSRLRARASAGASALIMPAVRRAGRAYVGGDTVQDALTIAHRLKQEKLPNTLGFWDTADYQKAQVKDIYVDAMEHLANSKLDTYLSIKPPALKFDAALTEEVAAAAKKWNVRVHCDSHGPEMAEGSHAMEQLLLDRLGPTNVSTTLPGRWLRSLPDADWAAERGIRVRVVKGQWPDPAAPVRDQSAGYMEVIDRLAGRAREVGIASHDVPLIARAVARLRQAKTPFELELLYGMPMEAALSWARQNQVPVRVYVPFGKGFLPSAVGVLRRNPRLAWLVLKDFLTPAPRVL